MEKHSNVCQVIEQELKWFGKATARVQFSGGLWELQLFPSAEVVRDMEQLCGCGNRRGFGRYYSNKRKRSHPLRAIRN